MERKKRMYRHLKTLDEAQRIVFDQFREYQTGTETVAVRAALGRVLCEPVYAVASVPAYHAAAMDGVAVRAADTFGALPERPVVLPKSDTAAAVDTGDPLPGGCDAVVMIEQVEDTPAGWEIREPAYPWRNVRKAGEDIVRGEILLPARRELRPYDQAALLAAGVIDVEVFRAPRVTIIPTGDEIVTPENAPSPLPPGMLLEVNGQMLASMAEECGARAQILAPVPDKPETIRAAIESALETSDLVMIIAGSSAGTEDHTPALLESIGELLVHGVTVMPGKPALVAAAGGRPVIGIPGYPVSAAVAFREFARPLLYMMQGLAAPAPKTVDAVAARKIASKIGLEEHVRVILGRVGGRVAAMPIGGGAGVITSLVRAGAIVRIPLNTDGVNEGDTLRAELLAPPETIGNTLLVIGSHDLCIDLLGSLLRVRTGGRIQISSANVGSLGGLLALKKRASHIAGSHLLDTETGDYNRSYIHKHLPDMPVTLITLVHRAQGFMLPKGNPENIKSIADLARPDVTFVNRQPGSGTRILVDYELGKAGIDPESVTGYRNEETTHMSVAVAVASGAAGAGPGILAAALALDLDFIPIVEERYDLVIPTEYMDDDKIKLLIDIIQSEEFKEKVQKMGGYDTRETGRIVDL